MNISTHNTAISIRIHFKEYENIVWDAEIGKRDGKYYLYIILRFIMMVSYLSMIGMTLLFLRNVMMFLDIYFIIGGMIYVFLTLLYFIIGTVNIPVMCMAFADYLSTILNFLLTY